MDRAWDREFRCGISAASSWMLTAPEFSRGNVGLLYKYIISIPIPKACAPSTSPQNQPFSSSKR